MVVGSKVNTAIIFCLNYCHFLISQPVFVEVYGCQMNVNDTEIVYSVLEKHNYVKASSCGDADIIFVMTCAIREGAENKIWHRLAQLKIMKQEKKGKKEDLTVGIIGKKSIFHDL
jgi:tRNA A37 methylthiotransferase MiaB